MEVVNTLKYPPLNLTKKIKDFVRYPKIQLKYESDFKDDYSKMIKVLKVSIIQTLYK
jgi:hypothetical protein